MQGAEGDHPLVARLEPPGAGLGEGEMVSMGGGSPADEAGLGGNVSEMSAVADALWCTNSKQRFVDGDSLRPAVILSGWGVERPKCLGTFLTKLGKDGSVMGATLVGEVWVARSYGL